MNAEAEGEYLGMDAVSKREEVREIEGTQEDALNEFRRFMRDMVSGKTRGLLTSTQAARAAGVSEKYIRDLVLNGELRTSHYPLLGIRGIWGVDLKAWIDARKVKQKQQTNEGDKP